MTDSQEGQSENAYAYCITKISSGVLHLGEAVYRLDVHIQESCVDCMAS